MSALEGFGEIVSLMDRIDASGNKFPKVKLAFGDSPLVLKRNGERSRFPGSVSLTDGGAYGSNAYYGAITREGRFVPGADAKTLDGDAKVALWAILTRLRDGDAEAVFSEYGKKFGICCCCGRELTNDESVALGIGPICRAKVFG